MIHVYDNLQISTEDKTMVSFSGAQKLLLTPKATADMLGKCRFFPGMITNPINQ